MSTRCQFAVFPQGWEPPKKMTEEVIKKNATALCYRHSDGYPEGAGAELKKHVDAFRTLRGYDDEYLAARALMWMMQESEESLKEFLGGKRDVMSYGICRDLHGDIEFFYAVHAGGVTTYEVSGRDGKYTFKEI